MHIKEIMHNMNDLLLCDSVVCSREIIYMFLVGQVSGLDKNFNTLHLNASHLSICSPCFVFLFCLVLNVLKWYVIQCDETYTVFGNYIEVYILYIYIYISVYILLHVGHSTDSAECSVMVHNTYIRSILSIFKCMCISVYIITCMSQHSMKCSVLFCETYNKSNCLQSASSNIRSSCKPLPLTYNIFHEMHSIWGVYMIYIEVSLHHVFKNTYFVVFWTHERLHFRSSSFSFFFLFVCAFHIQSSAESSNQLFFFFNL